MTFTEKSGLVKVWVGLVLSPDNAYTIGDVPKLYNLQDVVRSVVEKQL